MRWLTILGVVLILLGVAGLVIRVIPIRLQSFSRYSKRPRGLLLAHPCCPPDGAHLLPEKPGTTHLLSVRHA